MLTFIANDENGLPQKRKHKQRACDKCRRRKKRCEHLNGSQGGDRLHKDTGPVNSARISSPLAAVADNTVLAVATSSHSPQSMFSASSMPPVTLRDLASSTPTGFIASTRPQDFDPPAGALGQASEVVSEGVPRCAREVSQDGDDSSFVGDLNPEAIFLAATSPQTTSPQEHEGVGIWSTRKSMDNIRASLSGSTRQLAASSLFDTDPVVSRLLLPYVQDQCMKLLPDKTHYIALETIFFEEVQSLLPVLDVSAFHMLPENSHSKILLKQALCLAASTNTQATSHLNLDLGQILSRKEFGGKLSRAIRWSLDLGLVKEKLVLIQVLMLLCLFTQLSEEKHLSADLNGRVVSLVQTLGLHLRTEKNRKDHMYVTRLFCCAWALDRLNAAFHGRPVLMHERDFGHDMKECIARQDPAFQLMLRVADLLDQVISLYRPTNELCGEISDATIPAFEKLLDDSGAHRVKSHLIATIETFYHAVAMLSCRPQTSQGGVPKSSTNMIAHARQSLSASRVTFIVGEEFHGQLSLLPFVPYSLSLALRVSYRELRTSKTPIFRARARKQMVEQCRLLRQLGEIFWSAVVMVELSEQTIREMDKVTFNIISRQQEQQSLKQHPQQEPHSEQQDYSAAYSEPSVSGNDHQEDGGAINSWYVPSNEMKSLPSTYDPNDFDLSLLDGMAEFDIFQHLDLSIDLDTIDATLGDFSQSYEFMGFPM